MKKFVLLLLGIAALGGAAASPSYPDWAYAVPTPENAATTMTEDIAAENPLYSSSEQGVKVLPRLSATS